MYILEGIAYKILLLHNVLNIPIYTKRVFFFFKDFIYFQRKGKGGRKSGREIAISCLSHASKLGTWPAT